MLQSLSGRQSYFTYILLLQSLTQLSCVRKAATRQGRLHIKSLQGNVLASENEVWRCADRKPARSRCESGLLIRGRARGSKEVASKILGSGCVSDYDPVVLVAQQLQVLNDSVALGREPSNSTSH